MTEPALLVVAHGSRDPRSAATVAEIVSATRRLRPHLRIEAAFLDHNRATPAEAVAGLVAGGHHDIIVVPLFLTAAYHVRVDVPAAVERAQAAHPSVTLASPPVAGPDPRLLRVVDDRLGAAIEAPCAHLPDALVLASAGTADSDALASICALARAWAVRRRVPVVAAFASASPPSTGEAVRDLRRQGYRRVAVGSLFIAPGTLPDRAAELALEAGAVAVSAPLGAHPVMSRLLLERYDVAASRRATSTTSPTTTTAGG
ncbi:MAG: hypothetical protein QOI06_1434 [Nocardioidaceae bacterium]|nr:hypothetical protein [Nocardioidaceae bacterium]